MPNINLGKIADRNGVYSTTRHDWPQMLSNEGTGDGKEVEKNVEIPKQLGDFWVQSVHPSLPHSLLFIL